MFFLKFCDYFSFRVMNILWGVVGQAYKIITILMLAGQPADFMIKVHGSKKNKTKKNILCQFLNYNYAFDRHFYLKKYILNLRHTFLLAYAIQFCWELNPCSTVWDSAKHTKMY